MTKKSFSNCVCVFCRLSLFSLLLLLMSVTPTRAGDTAGSLTQVGVWPKPDQSGPLGGWSSWRFNLAKKNLHKLKYESTGAPDGGGFVHLESDNDEFWCYYCEPFKFDNKGKTLLATTKIRCWEGRVYFRIFGIKDGQVTKARLLASFSGSDDPEWERGMTLFDADYDMIYFIFSGPGKVKADFSTVTLNTMGLPNPVRSKVEGWAKERREEKLDRGLIALPAANGVYLGWRLLNSDTPETGFHVYRKESVQGDFKRLTDQPLVRTTDYVDTTAEAGKSYVWSIRPIIQGRQTEEESTIEYLLPVSKDERKPYISIPLQGNYKAQDVSLVDVDGDGKLDYVVKQPAGNVDSGDAYWFKSKDTFKIEVYKSDGTFLWRHDLGWGVEQGIWYSPMIAWDLNGDGRAEIITRTVKAEGDPRDKDGRVHSKNEFATVFDGLTGKVIAETPWVSREMLGYNIASRNFLGIAYLDGKTPFLLVQRGTYSIIRISAYQLVGDRLEEKLVWSNLYGPSSSYGGGAHRLHAVDLDNDGRDELCVGSFVLDDDGSMLWNLGLGHPDLLHVGDLNPNVPGLEVYLGVETANKKNGMCMLKASTGEYLWGLQKESWHIGGGSCLDMDPFRPGFECCGYEVKNDHSSACYWFSASGELLGEGENSILNQIAGKPSVYWNETTHPVILRGDERKGAMQKIVYKQAGAMPELETYPESFVGAIKATGDFLGDWREEFITSVPGELRIYSTTRPAKDRHVCLLQDHNYRATTIENTVGYRSKPILSYDIQTGTNKLDK